MKEIKMVTIIDFEDKYAGEFRQLNLEWLEKYQLLESHDQLILDDPRGMVLDRGGFIYLASAEGEIVGTAALVREHGDEYELAKMTVAPLFRGQGISKLLIETCLNKAREIGVGKLVLYSNSQLQTAIKLYVQYGFRHVPPVETPYTTADIKMELLF